jgi:putative two-component system response regulator
MTNGSPRDIPHVDDDLFGSATRLNLLLAAAHILVIDDEEANLRLVARILARAGYRHVTGLSDARDLESHLLLGAPDLVITDLHMPARDGFAVIEALQPWIAEDRLPVLVVSGDAGTESRNRALTMGARDFVGKPLDPTELALRVRNQLETRLLFEDVRKQNRALRDTVHGRAQEVESVRLELLSHLATASEYRDGCTAQHTVRVGQLSARLAEVMGLDPADVHVIRQAAPLHDLGKIGVPDGILRKTGALTEEEMAVMRTHTEIGADILRSESVGVLQVAEEIALTHHEHWDGRGYPRGLTGTQIPLSGRIVAVADTFDAITSDRPYRPARSTAEAIEEIVRFRGTQFDPAVVDALRQVANQQAPLPSDAASRSSAALVAAGASRAGDPRD